MRRLPPDRLGWLASLLVLVGCTSVVAPPLPTPIPEDFIPTAIAMTVEASNRQLAQQQATLLAPTETPLPTATATATLQPPAVDPSPTVTPAPLMVSPTATVENAPIGVIDLTPLADRPIPYAPVQILQPGPFSKVTSPIALRLYVFPTETRRVLVELLGEDGRLLARKLLLVGGTGDQPQTLTTEIPFEISAVAELALVRVSLDDGDQRLVSVNSIPVFLFSVGNADVLLGADLRAPVVIDQPGAGALVQGGKLVVSGLVRATEEDTVRVVLTSRAGGEIASRLVFTLPSAEADYRTFAVELPYKVTASTWARLSVQVLGNRPHVVMYLASEEVLLSP